jgi:prostamide/prostaglandin F2alpha synthase
MATDRSQPWRAHRRWEAPPAEMPFDRLHTSSRWPWWLLDSARTRQRVQAPERADGLADIRLPDQDGRPVRLGDLWSDRPAVIVWLRQYGCPFCRSYARRLNRARSRFEAAGSAVTLVGQGSPDDAARFRRRYGIELRVLSDESRASYLRCGTKIATLDELVGPAVIARGLVAMGRTLVFIGHNTADEAQLGGSMVVARTGAVAFAHVSEDASDMASAGDLLAAVRRAATEWGGQ